MIIICLYSGRKDTAFLVIFQILNIKTPIVVKDKS